MLTTSQINNAVSGAFKEYHSKASMIHTSFTLTHFHTMKKLTDEVSAINNAPNYSNAQKVVNMLILLYGQRDLIVSYTECGLLPKKKEDSRAWNLVNKIITDIVKNDNTFQSGLDTIINTAAFATATACARNYLNAYHWNCNPSFFQNYNPLAWSTVQSAASWLASWFVKKDSNPDYNYRMGMSSADPKDPTTKVTIDNFTTTVSLQFGDVCTNFERNYNHWENLQNQQIQQKLNQITQKLKDLTEQVSAAKQDNLSSNQGQHLQQNGQGLGNQFQQNGHKKHGITSSKYNQWSSLMYNQPQQQQQQESQAQYVTPQGYSNSGN